MCIKCNRLLCMTLHIYMYMYVYVSMLRFLRNILWQSSIDHCCRYLAGDSAKIMASTLLNVAHDDEAGSSILLLFLFFFYSFFPAANHGDCIALRLSRKLNCLEVELFLFCFILFGFSFRATGRMSDLFRIRRVCAIELAVNSKIIR